MLKGSRLLAALPTLARPLDCESSGNRGFEGIREGTDSGGQVLESLVAHRLIDIVLVCQLRQRTMGSTGWEVSQLFGYCSGPIEPVSRIYAQHVDQECPVRSTIWIPLI